MIGTRRSAHALTLTLTHTHTHTSAHTHALARTHTHTRSHTTYISIDLHLYACRTHGGRCHVGPRLSGIERGVSGRSRRADCVPIADEPFPPRLVVEIPARKNDSSQKNDLSRKNGLSRNGTAENESLFENDHSKNYDALATGQADFQVSGSVDHASVP
jgi:hypothetical protein